MTYDLYDEKGACQICSTSTVQRRVERSEFNSHARLHKAAGDPVVIKYAAGIRKASDSPNIFQVVTEE